VPDGRGLIAKFAASVQRSGATWHVRFRRFVENSSTASTARASSTITISIVTPARIAGHMS
jgi:hypothetical protein